MSVTPNQAQMGGEIVKRVNGTITGTTPLTIWTPEAGNRIRLFGVFLTAQITTVLAGATPFDTISVCDATSATPLWDIGKIVTATDAVGLNYGSAPMASLPYGYPLAAIGNLLVVTTAATIGTGVIRIRGFVYGSESLG
jgi:hypothetical protein